MIKQCYIEGCKNNADTCGHNEKFWRGTEHTCDERCRHLPDGSHMKTALPEQSSRELEEAKELLHNFDELEIKLLKSESMGQWNLFEVRELLLAQDLISRAEQKEEDIAILNKITFTQKDCLAYSGIDASRISDYNSVLKDKKRDAIQAIKQGNNQ